MPPVEPGRDVLVSSYFSHRNSHPVSFAGVEWPELVPHRERLLKHPDEEKCHEENQLCHGSFARGRVVGWVQHTTSRSL